MSTLLARLFVSLERGTATVTRPTDACADGLELALGERVSLFLVTWIAVGVFVGFVTVKRG